MTSLQDIEAAIKRLPSADLAAFRAWFSNFDSDAWDMDIARDALSGKLDTLVDEAKTAAKNNQTTPL